MLQNSDVISYNRLNVKMCEREGGTAVCVREGGTVVCVWGVLRKGN